MMTDHAADPTPYAAAASLYWQAGWRGILPLPPRQKADPPKGYTGRDGLWPSYPDVYDWTEQRPNANIALRLPPDVIGVDVDHYGDKRGGDVLAQLEHELGPLPATWRVTSRDDGVSGIRLFRCPTGMRWPGVFGPGIESIRYEHRYAVVWPSIHPEGRTYRWIGPDGLDRIGDVPNVTDLPDLPDTWIEHFTRNLAATDQPRADLNGLAVNDWITRRGQGVPCKHMNAAISRGLRDVASGSSRHDATLSLTNRLVWLAGEGHTGGLHALTVAYNTFMQAVAGDRDPQTADAEWGRMIDGAVRMAAAAHPNPSTDPCLDPFHGLVAARPKGPDQWPTSPGIGTTASPAGSTASSIAYSPPPYAGPPATGTPSTSSPSATGATPPSASASATATAPSTSSSDVAGLIPPGSVAEFDPYADIRARFRAGGGFILDIPDHVPAIWGRGDDVLWADGEALTIAGPPGVGKTTLCGQVVKARIIGGDVLGLPVEPSDGRVLYLAMDRPRQIARALRRTLGDVPRGILDQHLVIWPGPPIADVALHPETLYGLAELAGADTVIIDSIKDAAVGLSNDEVGAGYNRARQMCIARGIQMLELHHTIKKGEGGNPPKTLADMYGSTWIGAGTGSVLMLSGVAGEPIVQMLHLKQPAEEVGPWRLIHDHQHGVTTIFHATDLVLTARLAGHAGLTAKQAACVTEEKDNPTPSEVEKARRRLDKLADQGFLQRVGGGRGNGQVAVWMWLTDDPKGTGGIVPESGHESGHAPKNGEAVTAAPENHGSPDLSTNSGHESGHGGHGQSGHVRTPLYRGGGAITNDVAPGNVVRQTDDNGRIVYVDTNTGEVVDTLEDDGPVTR